MTPDLELKSSSNMPSRRLRQCLQNSTPYSIYYINNFLLTSLENAEKKEINIFIEQIFTERLPNARHLALDTGYTL